MASEKDQENGNSRGFSGLSSMVSEIESVLPSESSQSESSATGASSEASSRTGQRVDKKLPETGLKTDGEPDQQSGESSIGKWLFGLAAAIGIIWFISQLEYRGSSESSYAPVSSSTQAPVRSTTQTKTQAKTQIISRPTENRPSVGRNNVLMTAQIRYCLAEKIRIDAAESVLNSYNKSAVNRFNSSVDDYNSRCGEYRYRQGDLGRAQRDIEPYRSQIAAEGRSLYPPSSSGAPKSPSSTMATTDLDGVFQTLLSQSGSDLTDPEDILREQAGLTLSSSPKARKIVKPPDSIVRSIQLRLNELGYSAGTADGLFGKKTRNAIRAFQLDNGLLADGVASSSLLSQLISGTLGGGASQNDLTTPLTPSHAVESSSDRANFKKCMDGRYPSLCNHSLLTHSEAERVEAAERKANFKKCMDGRYPSLCNHSLLTYSEAGRVDAAERKANFKKCMDGRYPSLCNHSLLTHSEAERVDAAERKANFKKCVDGRYPSLCNHSILSFQEAELVADAESRASNRTMNR